MFAGAWKKSRTRHVDEHIPVGASITQLRPICKVKLRIIDTRVRAANVTDSILEKDFDPAIEPASIKVEVVDGIDGASAYEPTELARSRVQATHPQMADRHHPDVKRAATEAFSAYPTHVGGATCLLELAILHPRHEEFRPAFILFDICVQVM